MYSCSGCAARTCASSTAPNNPTPRRAAGWDLKTYSCRTLIPCYSTGITRLLRPPAAQPAQHGVTTGLAKRLQDLGAQLVLGHPELRAADPGVLESGLQALSEWVPRRSLAGLLERHPPILTAPVGAWADFLTSFGFQRLAVQELFLNSPDVITGSSVFRAGQVFLFLRQLGVPNEEIVGPIFRWRALLAEGVDYVAAASFLSDEGGVAPESMPRLATTYPALLAAPLEGEGEVGGEVGLRPRLDFLRGLGPEAPRALRGVLWEDWCGWLHGVANWSTAVAPKLAALEGVVGGRAAAEELLRRVPEALKYPPESRLAPNLRLLMGAVGLSGESLAALLRGAPALLSLSPDQLESRWTFLVEAANGSEADLLAHPPYLLAPLAKVTGPRLYYTAVRGLTQRLTAPQQQRADAAAAGGGSAAAASGSGTGRRSSSSGGSGAGPGGSGSEVGAAAREESGAEGGGGGDGGGGGGGGLGHDLDLRWLVEGSDEEWLRRVAAEQRRRRGAGAAAAAVGVGVVKAGGDGRGQAPSGEAEVEDEADEAEMVLLRGDYEEVVSEWDSLLGWCCDKAFTAAGRKRFEEQLSLFYLLVQG